MNDDSSNVSAPRLARLVKGDQGYGFNLHGDKSQPGQIISAVDKDSPAEIGGLREGDRLIEVNGTNVENISHGEVVKKIKENPSETSLLVCDKETLAYLKKNDRICTADMVNLSTVFVEPEPLLANGDAKPDLVAEKIEESEPVAVEESAPPPAPVSNEETDAVVPEPEPSVPAKCAEPTGPEPTPDEAVKELNSVLDEQEAKPAEVPVVEPEPPKTKEPEVPKAEPAKSSDSDLQLDMKSARPSRNLRKSAKQSGEAWKNKVNVLDSL